VPHNLDQYLNMSLVERSGAGVMLRSEKLSVSLVRRAVMAVLGDAGMRERAEALARTIQSKQSGQQGLQQIRQFFALERNTA
jgi:UDP:flavonoid glycosyltransferase YjiC (YdhE family)